MVIRPILFPPSTNQRFPSRPTVMPAGPLFGWGSTNSAMMSPRGVMTPIVLPVNSQNQRFPSGPGARPRGELFAVGIGNSVILPFLVIRPIRFPNCSVNQSLLSGPNRKPPGPLFGLGRVNSVIGPSNMESVRAPALTASNPRAAAEFFGSDWVLSQDTMPTKRAATFPAQRTNGGVGDEIRLMLAHMFPPRAQQPRRFQREA